MQITTAVPYVISHKDNLDLMDHVYYFIDVIGRLPIGHLSVLAIVTIIAFYTVSRYGINSIVAALRVWKGLPNPARRNNDEVMEEVRDMKVKSKEEHAKLGARCGGIEKSVAEVSKGQAVMKESIDNLKDDSKEMRQDIKEILARLLPIQPPPPTSPPPEKTQDLS